MSYSNAYQSALLAARIIARESGIVLKRFRRIHDDDLGLEWMAIGVRGGFVTVWRPVRDLGDTLNGTIVRTYGDQQYRIRICP
jgi:hypothetical protein